MFISSQSGRPFAEVATSRKQALGLSFRQLERRTKDLDDTGRGLSSAYLVQLLNGNEHPVPRNITLTAQALEMEPEAFVEYRLHQIRDAFDERVSFERAVRNLDALGDDALARLATGHAPREGRTRNGRGVGGA